MPTAPTSPWLPWDGSPDLSKARSRARKPRPRYQSAERDTSWSGTLLFGVVFQLTHTYRAAIVALVVFFVLGGVLLARVDVRRGVVDAGNEVPAVV